MALKTVSLLQAPKHVQIRFEWRNQIHTNTHNIGTVSYTHLDVYKRQTYNLVATGNLAARAFVPKEVLDDPAVYPSDEVAKTLVFLEDLGESEALYDTAWEALKKA